MGSKRTKQHEDNDFHIDEGEADLFFSLKNAFSNLVLDDNKGKDGEKFKHSYNPSQLQFGISDHKAIAQQIDPDQLSKQLETLFNAFLPTTPKVEPPKSPPNTTTTSTTTTTTTTTTTSSSSPALNNNDNKDNKDKSDAAGTTTSTTSSPPQPAHTSPAEGQATSPNNQATSPKDENSKNLDPAAPPSSPVDPAASLSDLEKFERVENEIFLISETVQYMQRVLPPTSQRTLECLSKVTDQYVKGWGSVESKQDLRQRYCIVLDKVGGWWLDEFLLFPELTIAEKEKWLNLFLRRWTRGDGTSSGIEGETNTTMRIAPSRRPTPPPSPPEAPMDSMLEYDEYIARQYQQRYEDEHSRSVTGRTASSESMDDYYLAASIQREEQEEIENRRLMSEIEAACAETEAKTLSGDADNEEMGEVVVKNEIEGEINEIEGEEGREKEGEKEGEINEPSRLVKDESMTSMTDEKPDDTFDTIPENTCNSNEVPVNNVNTPPTNVNITPDNNNNNENNNNNNNNNIFTKPDNVKFTNFFDAPPNPDDLDMPTTTEGFAGGRPKIGNVSKWKSPNYNRPTWTRRKVNDSYDEEDDDNEASDVLKRPQIHEWLNKHDEDERSYKLKRGRSDDDIDDDSDNSDFETERMKTWKSKDKLQTDRFDLLNTTWRIIKNMQIVGSMRFELYKKCGMYEEALKIAQALQDREKIMESRVLAKKEELGPSKNDDELEKAMKSMLHL